MELRTRPAVQLPGTKSADDDANRGLDEQEAQRRLVARRRLGRQEPTTSRSVAAIVRSNVCTRFNAILGVLLGVILVVGPLQDALFGVVLVANAAIGIVQELRAKASLDRLAVVTAPSATVIRSGVAREVAIDDVVEGDLVRLSAGDQVVADGEIVTTDHLEVDESLLTGESDPVEKTPGDDVLSGSFVVAGTGAVRVAQVGADAYARRLATEAKAFSLVRSELRGGIDRVLRMVTWLLLPTAALLVGSQLATHDSLPEAVRGSVAGVGSMIPEGLVLLTSVAFAASVIRLGQRHVLIQDLAAVEVLARVDTLCVDKTGTLTEPDVEVSDFDVLDERSREDALAALAALATMEPEPNSTVRAIGRASGEEATPMVAAEVAPFSSARKWSAFTTSAGATWVLGAPEIVIDPDERHRGETLERVERHAATGRRVLLLARSPNRLGSAGLPPDRRPVALVVLEERLRPDARSTLEYLAREGVVVKVLSGDHPATVAAVAERCGLDAGVPVDARTLPSEPGEALADAVEQGTVFGRVTPHQKRDLVHALQSRGHVVAMTGDGVNDVLALKAADLGVAMASGSAASRAVAPVVLLSNSFGALPAVVVEGRRVIANVERVAKLFVTKTVYAFVLAVAVGVARLPFPFLPRHLTIVSSLTIGIPAFFLALSPNAARSQPGFVARALRFAIPAGTVAATATFLSYALVRAEPGTSRIESRTAATLTLFGLGLWVLTILARPWTANRRALVAAMVGGFLLVAAVPSVRGFFDLELPRPIVTFAVVGVIAAGNVVLELGWQATNAVEAWARDRRLERQPGRPWRRRQLRAQR